MKRNHIHFAPGEPGDGQVISGKIFHCCYFLAFFCWLLFETICFLLHICDPEWKDFVFLQLISKTLEKELFTKCDRMITVHCVKLITNCDRMITVHCVKLCVLGMRSDCEVLIHVDMEKALAGQSQLSG